MATSSLPALIINVTNDWLAELAGYAPTILTAFAILAGLGFGMVLFRSWVTRKKH